jgi:hypothetical protein
MTDDHHAVPRTEAEAATLAGDPPFRPPTEPATEPVEQSVARQADAVAGGRPEHDGGPPE